MSESQRRGGSSGGGNRGRGGGSARGGGGGRKAAFGGSLTSTNSAASSQHHHHGKGKAPANATSSAATTSADSNGAPVAPITAAAAAAAAAAEDVDDVDLCFICAEPISTYSIGACNHPTCHICAIRLRALYKKKDCTFCKTPIDSLIFTASAEREFDSFTPEELPFSDKQLSVKFETQASMEETLILLRFNCPDGACEEARSGWGDLKSHVRRDHQKFMCDLCVRNKKIFAHEHTLHTHASLSAHIDEEHGKCDFCREQFYGDDELFVHMRDKHEQCHICKARGGEAERWRYFKDYNMLERHFKSDHHLCSAPECLEKKFVVFESEMDFQAHRLQEHSAELSSRERRDLTRVEANFTYSNNDDSSHGSGGGASGFTATRGGRSRRQGRGGREPAEEDRERDPLATSLLANRAHVAGAGPANHVSRRAAFGGNLTGANGASPAASGAATPSGAHTPREDEAAIGLQPNADPATVERHQLFLARAASILKGSESRLASFRGTIKAFRSGEMSGRDLADTIHSLVEEIDEGSILINGLVGLLEDEGKRRELLAAWNALRIERTQFPSLTPQAADGPGRYAGIAGGQVRSAKAGSQAGNAIWANVERAASSSSGHKAGKAPVLRDQFPTLRPGGAKSAVPGSAMHARLATNKVKAAHGSTPWSGAASSSAAPTPATAAAPRPYSVPGNSRIGGGGKAPPKVSTSAFPGLPSNANVAALNAHKRAVLANSKGKGKASASASPGASGSSTPALLWGDQRIDAPEADVETQEEHHATMSAVLLESRLMAEQHSSSNGSGANTPAANGQQQQQQKKKPKKVLLSSMGGVHRGL